MKVNRDENCTYNQQPVHYCTRCMSLKVLRLDDLNSYCGDCGVADIAKTDIFTWEKLVEEFNNKKE